MKSCILSDRLYVPVEYVTDRELSQFVYNLESDEDESEYNQFASGIRQIKTFVKVRIGDDLYYGFARGNIGKLGQLFGDLPWQDMSAAPPMASDLKFTGQLFNWKDHGKGQLEAASSWLKQRGGVIRASPRFGKTVTSIYILTQLKLKTIIIAHQKDLLQQFYNTFLNFTNIQELREQLRSPFAKKRDAKGEIVGFFNDYDNPEELDVCFLCWQTFGTKAVKKTTGRTHGDERIEKYAKAWGLVICDEAHKLGGVVFSSTVNKLAAKYRLGLTGTVERVDGKEFLLRDIIGPVTAEGKSKQVPCYVTVVHTGTKISFGPGDPFLRLHKRLYADKKRMNLILDYLEKDVAAGHYICFAFHPYSVAQLNQFTDRLKAIGIKAASFYGGLPNREQVLEDARDGNIQVLVCNSRMLTGIDVPRWNCYYSAFPSGNVIFNDQGQVSGNFYQEYSRVRTPYVDEDTGDIKKFGIIRDFVDENGICQGMYRKRYQAYMTERFQLEVIKTKNIDDDRRIRWED